MFSPETWRNKGKTNLSKRKLKNNKGGQDYTFFAAVIELIMKCLKIIRREDLNVVSRVNLIKIKFL